MNQQEFAKKAEQCVVEALIERGWSIVVRNYRHIGFEIDLVAEKGETTAIVEVKARSVRPTSLQEAVELFPVSKQKALVRGAKQLLSKGMVKGKTLRFDLAVVTPVRGELAIGYFVDVLEVQ